MVYKGLKPVHWCTQCQTALAEAEVDFRCPAPEEEEEDEEEWEETVEREPPWISS